MVTLAVVDIGSNAIRMHISNLLVQPTSYEFKTLEYMRIPVRLGEDVFKTGSIGEDKVDKLIKLGQSLVNLFELYEVKHYLCGATSAMRESTNREEVIQKVKESSGFQINVIDGDTEAEWANKGLKKFVGDGMWLHVDVGGGSSEINLYQDKRKVAGRSFKIGAVRLLLKEDVSSAQSEMVQWIHNQLSTLSYKGDVMCLGTGGNITKLYELAHIKNDRPISLEQIKEKAEFVSSHSLEDRINVLRLNPDRADVLAPSSKIYTDIMEAAQATQMFVPKVGLTDGMFEVLKQKLQMESR